MEPQAESCPLGRVNVRNGERRLPAGGNGTASLSHAATTTYTALTQHRLPGRSRRPDAPRESPQEALRTPAGARQQRREKVRVRNGQKVGSGFKLLSSFTEAGGKAGGTPAAAVPSEALSASDLSQTRAASPEGGRHLLPYPLRCQRHCVAKHASRSPEIQRAGPLYSHYLDPGTPRGGVGGHPVLPKWASCQPRPAPPAAPRTHCHPWEPPWPPP